MQFTTTLLAILSATPAIMARPSERRSSSAPQPRACGDLVAPSVGGGYFELSAATGNRESLTFDLSGRDLSSGPCTLVQKFSAGFPVTVWGEPQVRVLAGEGSNAPPGSEVGSFRVEVPTPGESGRVINSFQCKEVLGFDFAIENVEAGDRVAFTADAENGLFVQVGC